MSTHPISFSAIIPVYNGEKFLQEAIDSVLAQTHLPAQILVIDDGSTDSSAAIAAAYPQVTTISQSNHGGANALNAGIAESSCSVLAFLDADDVWHAGKLAAHSAVFSSDDSPDYAVSRSTLTLTEGTTRPNWCRPELLQDAFVDYTPSSLVVKKDALTRIGGFDESIAISYDVEWVSRARDAGLNCAVIEQELQQRRIHGDNQTGNVDRIHNELLSIMARKISEKRARSR